MLGVDAGPLNVYSSNQRRRFSPFMQGGYAVIAGRAKNGRLAPRSQSGYGGRPNRIDAWQ